MLNQRFFLGVFVVVAGTNAGAQGSGNTDGPITAATYDAVAIRRKFTDNPAFEAWMTGQKDSCDVVSFIENPLSLLAERGRIPTRERLKQLQQSALNNDARAAAGLVTPAGGATSAGLGGSIIYGTADFVVARAKEELVVVAVNRAKDWFRDDVLLQRLFPNSYDAILSSGDATLDGMLQLLRTAGRRDLTAMPQFVRDTLRARCPLNDKGNPTCSDKTATTIDALVITTMLFEHTAQGDSPLAVLDSLGTQSSWRDVLLTSTAKHATHVAGVAARECPNANCSRLLAMIPASDARNYVAVLFAREALDTAASVNTAKLDSTIKHFQTTLRDIKTIAADLKGPGPGAAETRSERLARYATILDGVATVTDDGVTLAELLDPSGAAQFATVATGIKHCTTLMRAVAHEDFVGVGVEVVFVAQDAGLQIPGEVIRWTTFGSSLASASTPADVQVALENFALPNGSYVAKRTVASGESGHLGVYINSYLGLSGGAEILAGGPRTTSAFGGVSLPVGLEFAYAGTGGSASLFIAVVDLGAVASYRFSDSDASSLPNVGFPQVIAPGLFVTFSPVRAYPFSLGLGYQYAPKLRDLTTGKSVDAARIAALLSFDVPLFRIR